MTLALVYLICFFALCAVAAFIASGFSKWPTPQPWFPKVKWKP